MICTYFDEFDKLTEFPFASTKNGDQVNSFSI